MPIWVSAHPIDQQVDPGIDPPSDYSNRTERQNTSQQSQNITEIVNQIEVPKPPHSKKQSTSKELNKPQSEEKEKKTTQEGNQNHVTGTNDAKNKTISTNNE